MRIVEHRSYHSVRQSGRPENLKLDPEPPFRAICQSDVNIAVSEEYPSPPMSEPASPASSHSATDQPSPTSRSRSPSTEASKDQRGPAPFVQGRIRLGREPAQSSPQSFTAAHLPTRPVTDITRQLRTDESFEQEVTGPSTPTTSGTLSDSQQSSRTGRKAKAHVASACVNCKRAHLSCDVQRPCARCVASGRQDTCFDVQHKKRGRPRLRDDAEAHDRVMGESSRGDTNTPTTLSSASVNHPAIRPRQDRELSLRPLASHKAADDGQREDWAPSLGPSPVAAIRRLEISPQMLYDIPTAFVDLDLRVMKASYSFEYLVAEGADVRGVPLSELFSPADGISLQAIEDGLRGERRSRDPSYLPPILGVGDPLPDVSDLQVESCTSGFSDNNFLWSFKRARISSQGFGARVRLAKGQVYFAVVTLPAFQQPKLPASDTIYEARPIMMPSDRQQHSQAQASYYPLPWPPGHSGSMQALTQPRSLIGSPMASSAYLDSDSRVQLPPLLNLPKAELSGSEATTESSRKRPRMSIDDVLQQ